MHFSLLGLSSTVGMAQGSLGIAHAGRGCEKASMQWYFLN